MANSVTARFNDNCKVHVAMSDDTTVTKAVIIDADGNETEIGGGGGSSDFSTATVTVTSDGACPLYNAVPIIISGGEEEMRCIAQIGQAESVPIKFVLFKEHLIFSFGDMNPPEVVVTGNIEYNDGAFLITGDGTITITTK